MTTSTPVLHVQSLECQRGESLLFSGISFELQAGQVLHIGGANGSGKTSLLRIVAGLGMASEGDVYWRGEAIRHCRSQYAAEMAYLGHHLGLKSELSVAENLRIGLALNGKSQDEAVWLRALARVGVRDKIDFPVRTLSAGQRQRVALARLLAQEACFWILDEPFTALDATGIQWVQTLLNEHRLAGGMALLTSHQPVSLEHGLLQLNLG